VPDEGRLQLGRDGPRPTGRARGGRIVTAGIPVLLVLVGAVAFGFYAISGLSRTGSDVPGVVALDVSYAFAFGLFLPIGAFIGWVMAVIGLSAVLSEAMTEYATRALLVDPGSLPGGREATFVSGLIGVWGIGSIAFLMLLFPTGTLVSPRWRWVARATAINLGLLFVANLALWEQRGVRLLEDGPIAGGLPVPYIVYEVLWSFMLVTAVLGLVSLIVRFRRSAGVERQQLKWMAFVAAIVCALVLINFFILELLFGTGYNAFRTAIEHLLNLSAAGIPIAAVIAITRYRLYDIDLVINRTIVYGVLSAFLAAVYALGIAVMQALIPFDDNNAATTLGIAALFRPARAQIQDFIDHQFYRRKYDAEKTIDAFTSRLRDEIDLDALDRELMAVVVQTMHPRHVSVWYLGRSS